MFDSTVTNKPIHRSRVDHDQAYRCMLIDSTISSCEPPRNQPVHHILEAFLLINAEIPTNTKSVGSKLCPTRFMCVHVGGFFTFHTTARPPIDRHAMIMTSTALQASNLKVSMGFIFRIFRFQATIQALICHMTFSCTPHLAIYSHAGAYQTSI